MHDRSGLRQYCIAAAIASTIPRCCSMVLASASCWVNPRHTLALLVGIVIESNIPASTALPEVAAGGRTGAAGGSGPSWWS